MKDVALSQEENGALAMEAEMARSLLGYGTAGPVIPENQHGWFCRPGQRAFERRARRSQRIGRLKSAAFPSVIRVSLLQNT